MMGLTFNRETANNLAVKRKDWQILTINSRKEITLAVKATTHWNPFIQNLHLHI